MQQSKKDIKLRREVTQNKTMELAKELVIAVESSARDAQAVKVKSPSVMQGKVKTDAKPKRSSPRVGLKQEFTLVGKVQPLSSMLVEIAKSKLTFKNRSRDQT
jgi:hypothetical protein